jgi:hypothetical protein
MVLQMMVIANVLTTRTVSVFTEFKNPFELLPHTAQTKKLDDEIDSFRSDMNKIDDAFDKENQRAQGPKYPYIHLMPRNIDASLSI